MTLQLAVSVDRLVGPSVRSSITFLVAYYSTLPPALLVRLFVCPSVRRSIRRSVTLRFFFGQRPRRGRSPVEHRGNLSVRPYVRTSVHLPHPKGFVSFGAKIQTVWPKSKQNGLNPGKMGQIQAKWAKSRQNGPNLARKPEFWPEFYHFGP